MADLLKDESPINRMIRSKEATKANYDRLSRWYDWLAGGSEAKFVNAGLQKLDVRPGEVVLEIGSGTGHALLTLAAAVGDTGGVYGLDLSACMLNITRQRVSRAGLLDSVVLKYGDAEALPCASNSFDTPAIPVVLHECLRVLRNGGRLGVVALSKNEPTGLMVGCTNGLAAGSLITLIVARFLFREL